MKLIPIPKAAGYFAGDDGHIYSIYIGRGVGQPRKMAGYLQDGYLMIRLRARGASKRVAVHRLIIEAFHGQPKSGQQARHLDGNRTNNLPSNLTWGTVKENVADKIRHGRLLFGEKHGMSKLNRYEVLAIKRAQQAGQTQRDIAKRFNISQGAVCAISTGKTWKWLLAPQ